VAVHTFSGTRVIAREPIPAIMAYLSCGFDGFCTVRAGLFSGLFGHIFLWAWKPGNRWGHNSRAFDP
jgi:hypothetical protein